MSNHEPQPRVTEQYHGEAIHAAVRESTETMKTSQSNPAGSCRRLSGRRLRRLRNAIARRKLQELHDEKVLQSWLAEVWEQPARRMATGDSRMQVR